MSTPDGRGDGEEPGQDGSAADRRAETDAEARAGTGAGAGTGDEPADGGESGTGHEVVSSGTEKYDARRIVTGDARYTADHRDRFPDLAEAAVVRSDVAHGRVVGIDTSAAEATEGVHAVLTPWDDAVPDTLYSPSGQSHPEPSPWDTCVLREHVRFVGDPVAAVAAENRATADRAARAIEVEYEEYNAVFDVWAATDPDAARLFGDDEVENETRGADYERNVESQFEGELGDPGAAFGSADDDQILETEWETPGSATR